MYKDFFSALYLSRKCVITPRYSYCALFCSTNFKLVWSPDEDNYKGDNGLKGFFPEKKTFFTIATCAVTMHFPRLEQLKAGSGPPRFRSRTYFGEIWLAAKIDAWSSSRGVEKPESLFIIKIPVMQHRGLPGEGRRERARVQPGVESRPTFQFGYRSYLM